MEGEGWGEKGIKEIQQEQAAAVYNRHVPPSLIKASYQPLGASPLSASHSF